MGVGFFPAYLSVCALCVCLIPKEVRKVCWVNLTLELKIFVS